MSRADGPQSKPHLTLSTPLSSRPLDKLRILLVEDCPDQQRMFLRSLEAQGAQVTLECNGQSAVEVVLENLAGVDTVIMDLQLYGMDGLTATRELREGGFQGPIVAITSFGNETVRKEWLEAGASVFLDKPLAGEQLVAAVCAQFPKLSERVDSSSVV